MTITGGHEGNIIGFVEFGRLGQEPNPFIRQSFDEKVHAVADQVVERIGQKVAEAAEGL